MPSAASPPSSGERNPIQIKTPSHMISRRLQVSRAAGADDSGSTAFWHASQNIVAQDNFPLIIDVFRHLLNSQEFLIQRPSVSGCRNCGKVRRRSNLRHHSSACCFITFAFHHGNPSFFCLSEKSPCNKTTTKMVCLPVNMELTVREVPTRKNNRMKAPCQRSGREMARFAKMASRLVQIGDN